MLIGVLIKKKNAFHMFGKCQSEYCQIQFCYRCPPGGWMSSGLPSTWRQCQHNPGCINHGPALAAHLLTLHRSVLHMAIQMHFVFVCFVKLRSHAFVNCFFHLPCEHLALLKIFSPKLLVFFVIFQNVPFFKRVRI